MGIMKVEIWFDVQQNGRGGKCRQIRSLMAQWESMRKSFGRITWEGFGVSELINYKYKQKLPGRSPRNMTLSNIDISWEIVVQSKISFVFYKHDFLIAGRKKIFGDFFLFFFLLWWMLHQQRLDALWCQNKLHLFGRRGSQYPPEGKPGTSKKYTIMPWKLSLSIDICYFWYFLALFGTFWYIFVLSGTFWAPARSIPLCPESFHWALTF